MYTIEKAKEAVKAGIRGYLLKDGHGKYVMKEVNRLPFYLEGSPGIGKTEIVRQIAEELNLGYVSFSLVHHTRNSLLGLPVIKELGDGDKYTCYTMSEIIAKVLEQKEDGYQEGILLLDEFPCMSESILPAMLSFLQTKNIGTHRLPEGWVIVLCGNPPEYNKTARTFDAAIIDRIRTLRVEFQPEVFLKYAEEMEIHPAILDYLRTHKKNVYRCKTEKKSQELVTCRGWENVSHMLRTYEALDQSVDREAISQFIKSEEIAAEFCQFYEQYCWGFSRRCAEDILKGVRVQDYVREYTPLSFEQKWRIVEYTMEYLVEIHNELTLPIAEWRERERMLAELEHLQAEQERLENEDLLDIDVSGYMPMAATTAILRLRKDPRFFCDAELRNDLMNRWYGFARHQNQLGKEVLDDGNLYQKCIRSLREWHNFETVLSPKKELKTISEKAGRLISFADQIDQGRSLLEMLVRKINNNDLLLMALSVHPNDLYLEMCGKKYAL